MTPSTTTMTSSVTTNAATSAAPSVVLQHDCPLCGTPADATLLGATLGFTCPDCALVSVGDLAPPDGYYDDYFDRFRSERDAPAAVLRDQQYQIDAAHLASYSGGGRILDVGCSAGGFLEAVEATGTKFEHLCGIDPDLSAIERCQTLDLKTPSTFFAGDVLELSAPESSFDAVVFRGTLQYVGPALRAVLAKVDHLLAEGGHVVFYALPNADSFLFHLLQDRWHLFNRLEHRLIFGADAIRRLARDTGWALAEMSYPYLETPYASPDSDYREVMRMVQGGEAAPVSFWGNMLQVVLRSPGPGRKSNVSGGP